jgi:hypothetical protein
MMEKDNPWRLEQILEGFHNLGGGTVQKHDVLLNKPNLK